MENEPKNSEFLQSSQWRKFQENVGRKTFYLENKCFLASIIEHNLPIAGKYLYCPRGPVTSLEDEEFTISNFQFPNKRQKPNLKNNIKNGMLALIELAKKEKAGWVRIEPENEEMLGLIRKNITQKIVKAPHDMQPKEIFVLDISKDVEILLAEMKTKTRYNIRLAKKRGVAISNKQQATGKKEEHLEAFLRLTKEMAARHGIKTHPENYYRKMIESLPIEMLKIYVAEYEGSIIAANLVLFYGKTATYLHGASGNKHRNVMAPFLLQWQAILDAKEAGCEKYDFGGIRSTVNNQQSKNNENAWEGITSFKLGFSPKTKPVEFPGSCDIVVNPGKYGVYRGLQRVRGLFHR